MDIKRNSSGLYQQRTLAIDFCWQYNNQGERKGMAKADEFLSTFPYCNLDRENHFARQIRGDRAFANMIWVNNIENYTGTYCTSDRRIRPIGPPEDFALIRNQSNARICTRPTNVRTFIPTAQSGENLDNLANRLIDDGFRPNPLYRKLVDLVNEFIENTAINGPPQNMSKIFERVLRNPTFENFVELMLTPKIEKNITRENWVHPRFLEEDKSLSPNDRETIIDLQTRFLDPITLSSISHQRIKTFLACTSGRFMIDTEIDTVNSFPKFLRKLMMITEFHRLN